MLDLKYIDENVELVKNKFKKRSNDTTAIDQIISTNQERKILTREVEEARSQVKNLSKDVGVLKKDGKDATSLMSQVSAIKESMENKEKQLVEIQAKLESQMLMIPNLVSDEVPVGQSEEDNLEIKRWGNPVKFDFEIKDHATLGEQMGMLDFEIATKMTGSRFVVYKDKLARLERALANFMIDFHLGRGYEEIIPPFIVHERALIGTGNLPKFKQDLFKLENTDWYLIPTAEVPVTNLKRDEIFSDKEFPLKYVSYTPCFRSEAGSYGKDTRGLIRMHQFNKVEMVNIVAQDQSLKAHDDMIKSACDILEALGLPYRAMLLCSADMGFSSQKTVDLEVWLPTQNKYREISSISNCGDFQSRRASIRYKGQDGKVNFAHTLNGSGLAVGRTLVAIMENYQTKHGSIKIPDVLIPYMGGIKEILPKSAAL